MENTNYAVLMKKYKLNDNLFILIPIKLVEGVLEESDGFQFHTMDGEYFPDINNSKAIVNPKTQEVTAYTIRESFLLQKYHNSSLEEAKQEYFKQICNATNIAFYLSNLNASGLLPLYLQSMVDKLNNKLVETEKNSKLNFFSEISLLPIDQYGYPLSSYEMEQMGYNNNEQPSQNDFDMILEELLKTDDVYTIHKVLEKVQEGFTSYEEIISSLSFSNMIETAKKDSFNHISISDIFSNSCRHILATNSKEEIIDIINQTSFFFTELYCDIYEMSSGEKTPEAEASCDFLDKLTADYQELQEDDKTVSEIHMQVKNIEQEQIDNIKSIQKNYQTLLKQVNINSETKESTTKTKNLTPTIDVVNFKEYLDERVVGQEEAKKRIICAALNQQISNRESLKLPTSCLLVGPTGSGKTLLAETIANYLDVPSIIFDMTQLTSTGYIGDSITDSLTRLLAKANNNIKKAEQGMVIFDEIDKKGSDSNKDISGKGALNALLPYLDGRTYYLDVNAKTVPFQTDKLMIVATGSFAEALETKNQKNYSHSNMGFASTNQIAPQQEYITKLELMEYSGIPKELIARIPNIILLEAQTEDSLKEILTRKKISPLYQTAEVLNYIDIYFSWDNDYIDAVAKKSYELGNGARSLNAIVEESIFPARWEVLANRHKYSGFRVTADTVEDRENALLYGYHGEEYQLKEVLKEKSKHAMQYKKK